jgi:transposase
MRQTVARWVQERREHGMQALKKAGRKPQLGEKDRKRLERLPAREWHISIEQEFGIRQQTCEHRSCAMIVRLLGQRLQRFRTTARYNNSCSCLSKAKHSRFPDATSSAFFS